MTQEHDVRIPTMGLHPDTGPGPSGIATSIRNCSTRSRVASHWKTVEGETISEGVKNYITDHSLSELSKISYTLYTKVETVQGILLYLRSGTGHAFREVGLGLRTRAD